MEKRHFAFFTELISQIYCLWCFNTSPLRAGGRKALSEFFISPLWAKLAQACEPWPHSWCLL
jgi:hypothetical protein